MRAPLRTTGLSAAIGAMTLLLTGAVPSGAPALFITAPSRLVIGAQPAIPAEPPAGALHVQAAVQELRQRNYVDVDPNGVVRAVTAPPGQSLGSDPDSFVARYAAAFGLSKAHTLQRTKSTSEGIVRYQQVAGGLPILGGEVVVTTASDGSVRAAITETTRLSPVGGPAKLDPAAAGQKGLAAAVEHYGLEPSELTVAASLWLYDASAHDSKANPALRPTYWVKVIQDGVDQASVLVDGITGDIKLIASEQRSAKQRVVCDVANTRVNLNSRAAYNCDVSTALGVQATTRLEAGTVSSVADVNGAFDRLGVAYDFYKNTFGIDSFDGHGAKIRASVRVCHTTGPCPYPNAFWDGKQFVFGAGWAVDDVVWHEYTHAVTEYSSDLYYWFESGAINEALSDIFGQFIDLQNPADDVGIHRWEMGEDLAIGAIRDMMTPSRFGDPTAYHDANWDYDWDLSDSGGVHTDSGVANHIAAVLYDGSAPDGIPALGGAKSAQLWFRTMHLLPSGADYRTLGLTLISACRQFIGKFGFTVGDCAGVEKAISLANLFPGRTQTAFCPTSADQAPADLFFDGMETGSSTRWTRTSPIYWDFIPSVGVPYSYAASGHGSINGWTDVGSAGHGQSIELTNPVTIPVGVPAFVGFDQSLIKDPTTSGTGIDVFVNAGSGWQPLSGFAGPIPSNTNRIDYTSIGFDYLRASLNAYAGQSVRLKFQVYSPSNQFVDRYLDNFRIYTCDPQMPGAPQDAYAYFDGSDLKIDWSRAGYLAGATGFGDYHYELSYDPTIPGAPATFVGSGSGTRFTLTIPGADPSVHYAVSLRVKMDVGAGLTGPATTAVVSPFPPMSCQTPKPVPLAPPIAGRRSAPVIPWGTCRIITPRRG